MNERMRMMIRAFELRTVDDIMATLELDNGWKRIVFVRPDKWEEAKKIYCDRLKKFLEE